MERILIATDGSPASVEAVHFGLELAADEGAAVTFVHVVPAYLPVRGFAVGAEVPHVPHEVTDDEYVSLEEAEALASERGVEATSKLLKGSPADEIVTYADSLGADLIVIGSRGRNSFTSTLLGSISRAVLAETRRPVLVVRGAPAPVQAEMTG